MPDAARDLAASLVVGGRRSPEPAPVGGGPGLRRRALEVLLHPDLAPVVALVCWQSAGNLHVADSLGELTVGADGGRTLVGRDPIADQDLFSDETACYPYAELRLRSLFADPRAPDLVVVHTGGHSWPERGGHRGEHGSLNGVQSRAPLLLSGAGVTERGVLEQVCRTVDIGATLTHLAGGDTSEMDGQPLPQVAPAARYVVGLLWDGAQNADLLAQVAAGALPNVARLLADGCALRGGAIADFPSVTLVNHTSALTGVGPGRHGIVHNAFYDRALGRQVVPNSAAQWPQAMQWLRPGVRTVWERLPTGTSTACVDEPCDRGATYSTFALLRASGGTGAAALAEAVGAAPADPHASADQVSAYPGYAWGSQVDQLGLAQVLQLWGAAEPPRVLWWNTTVTDAGHHAGGPGSTVARDSLADSDRRLGAFLDLVEARGLREQTVILLTADHGSQGADPLCTGDWDQALQTAGIAFRDEAYGFIYLGV